MADRDRIAAGLSYLEQQKRADPLESFRSLEGLKGAYERRVQPIINNAMQTFETGGAVGDLLRAYGSAAAPANAAVLEGMGMPYRGPMTAPREEGVTSGENFRAMGDPRQQAVGQMVGDPANLAQPVGARLANALKFAKPDAMKMIKEMSQGARSQAIPSDARISDAGRAILERLKRGEGRPGDVAEVMRDLQTQNLPIEIREQAAKIAQTNPAFAEAVNYMQPIQLAKAVNNKKIGQLYEQHWNTLPSSEELEAVARAGGVKKGWYEGAREATAAMLPGQESTRWAYGKSALSPQTSVQSNLENMASTYFPWRAAGASTNPQDIARALAQNVQSKPVLSSTGGAERSVAQVKTLARSLGVPDNFIERSSPQELRMLLSMYEQSSPLAADEIARKSVLPAWEGNFVRAMNDQQLLSGPKVQNFASNLDPNNPFAPLHTTNDTWDATLMGWPQARYGGQGFNIAKHDPGYSPGYTMSSAKKAQVADQMGWTPEQVQETTWSWTKPIGEGLGKYGLTPPANVINEVPDFQTLLRTPSIFNKLPQAEQSRLMAMPQSAAETYNWTPTASDLEHLKNAEKRVLSTRARYKGRDEE